MTCEPATACVTQPCRQPCAPHNTSTRDATNSAGEATCLLGCGFELVSPRRPRGELLVVPGNALVGGAAR